MARERGELTIAVNGRSWILRPTINAICELEDLTGQTFADVARMAERGSVTAMRLMVWCYLRDKHGAEIATPADAGAWMSSFGSIPELGRVLTDVAALNSDAPPEEKKPPVVPPPPPPPVPDPEPEPAPV